MGLLRFIAVGAAIGYGINYITKKGANGRSILDDITEDAPQWFDKAKQYAAEKVDLATEKIQEERNRF
ncbi:YtxH domain-containing protein [Mucilaginibacter pallidiroseus]|uniref:YtxH domain-containing protein n=1 Tax=Mucilaginibacter pallidiroseus TaxID=2599295 RepID=A0A563U7N5_9SPHI|nr:YtxH domain-containing protein [Mucilaginibacter pallidiroseus]TWR27382.1 YtxH domain-containing protein [Mucilaginibacter pallidiroseus]